MLITGGRVFDPQKGFVSEDLCYCGAFIGAQCAAGCVEGKIELKNGEYIIPGLIDLHFHGCCGEDFSDASADGLKKMAEYELSRGITGICPAGMTLSEEQLTKVCANAAAFKECGAAESERTSELIGVNLEGPFLSMAKKGAQNAEFLHAPDAAMLSRLQHAAKGAVKLVTIAPEEPGSLPFIEKAKEEGVRVSLGHTTADYETAMSAYKAGARQATHLFNAMPPFAHREPGVIGAALDSEGVCVELISDGVHIHPSVVRAVFRMFGADRVILISDSLRATGQGDGVYPFGGQEIEVCGPRATMVGHPETLAGSVSDLMACLAKAVSFGISLKDAVTAASVNPAKALGVYDRLGSLANGKEANIVILNSDLSLKTVIYRGKVLESK